MWVTVVLSIIGYGFIALIILYAHRLEKKEKQIIIDRIKARGYKINKDPRARKCEE